MKLYSRQNNITHFVTSKFDGTPCEGKLSRTVWCGGKSGDDVKGLPIAIVIKSKKAEGYVSTCFMILIFCIVIAVFVSFVTAVNVVRISKRNTYKIIDGYVTEKSIEAFNSVKVGTDHTEQLDNDTFKDYFCEYNNLTKNGNALIAYTEDAEEKYRVTDLNIFFIQDKSLKIKAEYTIEIPISFGDFNVVKAEVPITIISKYTDKFS